MPAASADVGEQGVDGRELRSAMSHFVTGVTVVTALGAGDAPAGSTANAVTSVSLDPPLVLVCLRRDLRTLAAVVDRGQFALNILGDGHEAWPGPSVRRAPATASRTSRGDRVGTARR